MMAMALPHYVPKDQIFNRLRGLWNHATLCIGGDSHARKLGEAIYREIHWDHFEGGVRLLPGSFNMGVGGATCSSYKSHAAYESLKYSNADIVLLTIGGNDLDLPRVTRDGRAVICDILSMFTELEDRGMVVFVVSIPTRYSKRNKDPAQGEETEEAMRKKIRYMNKTLRMILKGRLITLPAAVYQQNAFHRSFYKRPNGKGMEEFVHFEEHNYNLCARRVLQRLNSELTTGSPSGELSAPSFIERTVNQFFETREDNN